MLLIFEYIDILLQNNLNTYKTMGLSDELKVNQNLVIDFLRWYETNADSNKSYKENFEFFMEQIKQGSIKSKIKNTKTLIF